ncbi:hypothetical protein AB0K00_18140 [Dactylosporangium sp. NPDC049525]|uniref:hypothetical protein n=1 Tax=Dactylosporangium sp. NPDC049525 TaxID=3154730 RepID=UPI00343E02A6
MRRLDLGVFLVGGLLWTGFALGSWANWPMPADLWFSIAAIFLAVTCFGYLGGPAGKLTIHPDRLVVDNTFTRVTVPRRLLARVEVLEYLGVHLRLVDGEYVMVRAAMFVSAGRRDRVLRQLRVKADAVTELIESVPQIASTEVVRRRLRLINVAIACVALAGFVGSAIYIFKFAEQV